ncbi:MAG: hypothetical protein ACYC5X_00430 [Syntrophales bacterium]
MLIINSQRFQNSVLSVDKESEGSGFRHPTFHALPPLCLVFLETVSAAGELQVFSADAEPQAISVAAEPEVVSVAAEPEAVSAAAEPEAVSAAAELQVSVDIAVAFVVLVPVSVVVVEVYSSGRPKSPAFPNVDHFASASSSVAVVG